MKDIALLKYKDINNDSIIFYREKTKRTSKSDLKPTFVALTDFSKEVISKYGNKDKSPKNYIFSIISDELDEFTKFRTIKNFIISINKNIKKITNNEELTTYWARHSFATNALRNGASMEFVSEALTHSDMKTTQNYFSGFDNKTKKILADTLMDFN